MQKVQPLRSTLKAAPKLQAYSSQMFPSLCVVSLSLSVSLSFSSSLCRLSVFLLCLRASRKWLAYMIYFGQCGSHLVGSLPNTLTTTLTTTLTPVAVDTPHPELTNCILNRPTWIGG